MAVEIVPVNKRAGEIGVANGTWHHLIETTEIGEILGVRARPNDPIHATEEQAIACAKAIQTWVPQSGWFMTDKEHEGKEMFIDFFLDCGGFKTF